MFAHDWLDGLSGLICMIERYGANVMVKNMSLNDPMEKLPANKPKLPINCRCCASCICPGGRGVVRQGRICMLQESDGHFKAGSVKGPQYEAEPTYLASG